MESFEAEICTDVEKRDGRGRRLLGRDYWIGLLDAFERSDLTQKAFCQNEGGTTTLSSTGVLVASVASWIKAQFSSSS